MVLAGHVVAFLVPRQVLAWNSQPLRLYILETTALVFGLLTLVGLLAILVRRFTDPKVQAGDDLRRTGCSTRCCSSQVVTGLYTAVFQPWGSSWFAAVAAPVLSGRWSSSARTWAPWPRCRGW